MTTQSWSTRVRQDSDAMFREWGLEFSTKLAAAGLVQTSDTGQINWATVTRPGGGSADAGYEIWRMNDTEQATAPIIFKFTYGNHSGGVTAPRIQVGVGIASNGSGTVTTIGGGTATQRLIMNSANQTTDTLRNSYACASDGFFGINWKQGSAATEGFFFVCRTVDTSGVATPTGAICGWGSGAASGMSATQAMRFAATAVLYTAQANATGTALGFMPQAPASSIVGSDIQVALGWTITPAVAPLVGVCGVFNTEVATGNTFSIALVGATPHTYIALTNEAGPFGPSNSSTGGYHKYAMLWE